MRALKGYLNPITKRQKKFLEFFFRKGKNNINGSTLGYSNPITKHTYRTTTNSNYKVDNNNNTVAESILCQSSGLNHK